MLVFQPAPCIGAGWDSGKKPSVQYLLESYCGETLTGESLERSSESEEVVQWRLSGAQMDDNVFPFLRNPVQNIGNGNLDLRQRTKIRELAQKLKDVADSACIRPTSALLSVERAILVNEGLNQEEMQVVQSILLEKIPTVSKVAEHLSKLITSSTVRATLRYLCYSANSVPEELAVTCELIKLTIPRIRQLPRSNSVFEAINDFMQDRLDSVLH